MNGLQDVRRRIPPLSDKNCIVALPFAPAPMARSKKDRTYIDIADRKPSRER